MNIIEMYDKYRKQHAAEFKGLLEEVANEVLHVTEQIPEDVVWENFRTNSNRRTLHCSDFRANDGCLRVGFSDCEDIGQFSYNDIAAKKLDKFMKEYYPGIVCSRAYYFDLYDRTIEFYFEFNVDYNYDDFDWHLDSGELKDGKTNMNPLVELFNDDITEVLQQRFTIGDWDDLGLYEKEVNQRRMTTKVYDYGCVFIKIPI